MNGKLVYKLIGSKLKGYRTKYRLSTEHIEKAAELPAGYIHELEIGKVQPSCERLCRICLEIGIDPGKLMPNLSELK